MPSPPANIPTPSTTTKRGVPDFRANGKRARQTSTEKLMSAISGYIGPSFHRYANFPSHILTYLPTLCTLSRKNCDGSQ